MNSATIFASGLAAQLRSLSSLSVVQNDATLKSEIETVESCVTAYGALVLQLESGLKSFSTGTVAWQPLTFPMIDAGGRVMVEKAVALSARLRTIDVPAIPPRVPSWNVVKGNALGSAKDVVTSVASTAKSSVATAVVVGAKTLIGRNPFRTLMQRIGEERVTQVVDSIRHPVNSIQSAATSILPSLKRGLDLGVELGTEVAGALADMIPNRDYVTDATAEQLQREGTVAELSLLFNFAGALEQSAKELRDLGDAVVGSAAAAAIVGYQNDPAKLDDAQRELLRQAIGEIAEADVALAPLVNKMNDLFTRFASLGNHFRFATATGEATTDGAVAADVGATDGEAVASGADSHVPSSRDASDAPPAVRRRPAVFPLDAAGEPVVNPPNADVKRTRKPRTPRTTGASGTPRNPSESAAPRRSRKKTQAEAETP